MIFVLFVSIPTTALTPCVTDDEQSAENSCDCGLAKANKASLPPSEIPASSQFDSTELSGVLQMPISAFGMIRKEVRFGIFKIYMRLSNGGTVLPNQPKTLTIAQIDSESPGSKLYPEALKTIQSLAKEQGFKVLVLEGVDEPRHWKFYEDTMHFQMTPKSNQNYRTYYKLLE